MSDNQTPALAELAARNQITVVADIDHSSEDIKARIVADFSAMAANGVKHLFLEMDARDITPDGIMSNGGPLGQLVQRARDLGISIHLMDDRTNQRDRAARFLEEDEYRERNDPYVFDRQALITQAPNPDRMLAYLQDEENNRDSENNFRNERMVEYIANTMDRHAGEKALVLTGATHVMEQNDIDEGLRGRGYQAATAHIYTRDVVGDGRTYAATARDRSDIVVDAETGAAISYKIPGTNTMRGTASLPDDFQIPWTNAEPVADRNHPQMLCALEAAKGLDCSWNHGTNQAQNPPVSPVETGQMAAPPTQGQPPAPTVNGPPH